MKTIRYEKLRKSTLARRENSENFLFSGIRIRKLILFPAGNIILLPVRTVTEELYSAIMLFTINLSEVKLLLSMLF